MEHKKPEDKAFNGQHIISILSMNHFRNEIQGNRCVAYFFAHWCGPCQVFAPEFEKEANHEAKLGSGIKFLKINVDPQDNQAIAQYYKISSIPTVIFLKPEPNGHESSIVYHFARASLSDLKEGLGILKSA